jgi:hypothetical protein
LLALRFGLGKRYSAPGVSSHWAWNALKAAAVIGFGISPSPLGVLESGICTKRFSKSTSDFRIRIGSLYGRRPISAMMQTAFHR